MSHAHVSVRVHIIFSTKDRHVLISPELQLRLWSYLGGICRKLGLNLMAAGGMADHVHLLIAIPPAMAVATAVQKLKANSSRWMKEQGVADFSWQEGYGAFSVSVSHADATIAYIRSQAEHHRRRTFDDEVREILAKHGLLAGAVPAGL